MPSAVEKLELNTNEGRHNRVARAPDLSPKGSRLASRPETIMGNGGRPGYLKIKFPLPPLFTDLSKSTGRGGWILDVKAVTVNICVEDRTLGKWKMRLVNTCTMSVPRHWLLIGGGEQKVAIVLGRVHNVNPRGFFHTCHTWILHCNNQKPRNKWPLVYPGQDRS